METNWSFDLSSTIKLAKLRVFVYLKKVHKIKTVHSNLHSSGKPGI